MRWARIFDPWDDRPSPVTKLQVICGELGIDYDETKEPWSTLCWLSKFRNDIAHAKPELLASEVICGPEELKRAGTRCRCPPLIDGSR